MLDFDDVELAAGAISEVLDIRRKRWLSVLIVSVVILVVGLLIVVILTMKTVTLNFNPDRAEESSNVVGTKGLSIVLGRNVHFLGAIEVEAGADGFFPKLVALDRETESPITVELLPQPGVVSIELKFLQDDSRDEYSLTVNGTQLFDPIPESIELLAGTHELRVQGPLEYDSTQFVDIVGYGKQQTVSFTALPRGTFSVKVLPDTAEIKLNGTPIGTGEVRETVVAKTHVLEFEREGYLAKRLPFTVDASMHVDLGVINLTSVPGSVEFISEPASVSILVDGKFVGSTPIVLEFKESSVNVELRKPNFHSVQETVQVRHGATISKEYTLQAVRFDVDVSAHPKAMVTVNKHSHGTTPVTVNVTAGDLLEVSLEGYASQRSTIAPEEQQERKLDFELLDMETHVFNEAPTSITVQTSIQLKKFPSAKFRLLVPGYLMDDNRERTRDFEISRPFYFGIHEVRRKEFAKFDSSIKTTAGDENLPITDISWLDAVKFCNWLSESEGIDPVYAVGSGGSVSVNLGSTGYRLPTEAEWELIAYYHFAEEKAIGPFVWGDGTKPPSRVGNLAGFETRSALRGYIEDYGDRHKDLAPVGSYRRNFNGIHDLAGNASEWVHDYFGSEYEGWNKPLTNPMGPGQGIDRIVKGANYQTIKLSETAINFRRSVGYKDETVGFRIARWVL